MMNRARKDALIGQLQQKLEGASAFYLTDFTGLNVKQITQFRARLRKEGVEYVVVKNTLARRALDGLEMPDVAGFFKGPTGLVIGHEDAVTAAKVLTEFAKEFGDRPAVKVGVVERRSFGADEVKRLADMPPREILLAQIAGGLQAPMVRLASGMGELIAHAARLFALLQQQRERDEMTGYAAGPDFAGAAIATLPALPVGSAAATGTATAAEKGTKVISAALPVLPSPVTVPVTPQEINDMILEELNHIERWELGVALRERPEAGERLRIGNRYTLVLALGPPPESGPDAGAHRFRLAVRSTLVLMSRDVELLGTTPGVDLACQVTERGTLWRATAPVALSTGDPPRLPEFGIIPHAASKLEMNVLLFVGNQLYRDWVLHLHVTV